MRAAKSYLALHPFWFNEEPDSTFPRCKTASEPFQHTILTCPARTRVRDLLLKEVSSLGHDATLCSEPHLIRALGEYITHMKTGFPPGHAPRTEPSPLLPPPYTRLNQVLLREGYCSEEVWLFCFSYLYLSLQKHVNEESF